MYPGRVPRMGHQPFKPLFPRAAARPASVPAWVSSVSKVVSVAAVVSVSPVVWVVASVVAWVVAVVAAVVAVVGAVVARVVGAVVVMFPLVQPQAARDPVRTSTVRSIKIFFIFHTSKSFLLRH